MAAELPGEDLVRDGLADLAAGRETQAALLVSLAATRLREAGVPVPAGSEEGLPAHRLYGLLAAEDPDAAHGRYNALLRRMLSYARTAEHAAAR